VDAASGNNNEKMAKMALFKSDLCSLCEHGCRQQKSMEIMVSVGQEKVVDQNKTYFGLDFRCHGVLYGAKSSKIQESQKTSKKLMTSSRPAASKVHGTFSAKKVFFYDPETYAIEFALDF
jgi:hypothetical protein